MNKAGKIHDINLNNNDNALKNLLITAVNKYSEWVPAKTYGVPYEIKLTLPLKYIIESRDDIDHNTIIEYKETRIN